MRTPPIKELQKDVYLIDEFEGTNCYLVVGSEKCFLMDAGTGVCDIRGAVESITDKPIIFAATHGHGDHFGGAGQFEEMYLHEADFEKINRIQSTMFFRRIFAGVNPMLLKHGITAFSVTKPIYDTKWIPFDDSMSWDLGDKVITCKLTPGHTRGSVAFIDEADGIIFSGDNVCDSLWMMLPGCTSIEEWLPSAKWLYEASKTHKVYWGHRVPELTTEYIGTVVSWGEEILKNHKKNAKLSIITNWPHQFDGIIYRTGNIYQKK